MVGDLTVACVLRTGGEYEPAHVARLEEQVRTHLQGRYRFVCLSDASETATQKLTTEWPGWWAKMEIFYLSGPLLYLDLDTTIVGDLERLARLVYMQEFIAMRDVYRGRGDRTALQSSIMAWRDDVSPIARQFAEAPDHYMRTYDRLGDQGFIGDNRPKGTVFWQDVTPGAVVSYKADVRNRGVSDAACVIAFHGQPRPWDRRIPARWR